ncbi:hypothetical protein OPV22_018835 [Ensete ventricosum]|uniref:Uncharacterized protein n=1 Tax=Ensete ventricosum TaxID=4639 RepID=A0AAV8QWU0_ENSVE|nr:hypothetical protein OPV22_018835 [Ensete ventricosum]
MVGIFSRISVGWGHRRAQSAIDVANPLPPNMEEGSCAPTAGSHGFEDAIEFKPVEHPSEPLVRDQPVTCPQPEPSILNDGRIWKERITSASTRAIVDLPVLENGSCLQSQDGGEESLLNPAKCPISSSLSTPKHNVVALLEECSAPEDQALN